MKANSHTGILYTIFVLFSIVFHIGQMVAHISTKYTELCDSEEVQDALCASQLEIIAALADGVVKRIFTDLLKYCIFISSSLVILQR